MNHTIALVDDDRNILTSLRIALEKEGFNIQTYLDGESALIGLSRTPPDLAVIDIKMPRMDGEELLKKLRKKTSMPVIFLTSSSLEVKKITGIEVFFLNFFNNSSPSILGIFISMTAKSGGVLDKPINALSPSK